MKTSRITLVLASALMVAGCGSTTNSQSQSQAAPPIPSTTAAPASDYCSAIKDAIAAKPVANQADAQAVAAYASKIKAVIEVSAETDRSYWQDTYTVVDAVVVGSDTASAASDAADRSAGDEGRTTSAAVAQVCGITLPTSWKP